MSKLSRGKRGEICERVIASQGGYGTRPGVCLWGRKTDEGRGGTGARRPGDRAGRGGVACAPQGQVVDGHTGPGALITPYSIGKDLSAWVEKLFETSIPAETLKTRAARIQKQIGSNEPTAPTSCNTSEIPEKPQSQPVRGKSGKFEKGTAPGPGRPRRRTAPKPTPPPPEAAAGAAPKGERFSFSPA